MPDTSAPQSLTTSGATGTLDTVAQASTDAEREQPWAELGLKADEYARIREILGRRPTSSELALSLIHI